MIMTEVANAFFPTKAKELFSNLSAKQMNMDEFLSECSYWALQYLDQYRVKPLPTKPQEIVEFLIRVKQNATYETKPEFWRIPHIAFYVESARKVDGENRGNIGKLKMILAGFPKEDNISRSKVTTLLHEFESEYGQQVIEPIKQMNMDEIETEFFGE